MEGKEGGWVGVKVILRIASNYQIFFCTGSQIVLQKVSRESSLSVVKGDFINFRLSSWKEIHSQN